MNINNTRKIYIFSFFWMFLAIVPVMVPFVTNLGITMREFFFLQSLFGLTVAVFEVPSGYFCDLYGRKKALVLGSFLSAVGVSILPILSTFKGLMLFEFLLGLALALVSGADISLLLESVDSSNRKNQLKATANLQFSHVIAESLAAVAASFLVAYSFNAIIYLQMFMAWCAFLISFTLTESPYKKMNKTHKENLKKIIQHIFSNERIIALAFINLVIWGLSTFFAVWIFQKYWMEQNIPLHYFGLIWACYGLIVGLVGKLVSRLQERYGARKLLLLVGLLPSIGYLVLAFVTGWVGILIGAVFQVARGLGQILLKDALNWRTPSAFRATLNSLIGVCFRFSFFVLGPIVGHSIDSLGIQTTLLILSGSFIVLFLVVMVPLLKEVGDMQKRAPRTL